MRIAHRAVATFPGYLRAAVAASVGLLWCGQALAGASCPAQRDALLVPKDLALCARLEQVIRKPDALPLNEYEIKLAEFLRNFCHRNEASGWKPDKRMRDTGPFIGTFQNGKWLGDYHGTHAPVAVWYSPDMVKWLKVNRSETHEATSAKAPVPDGAIMVKEMYPPPISSCAKADLPRLFPLNGGAVMVRAAGASHDGWFWGWFGWKENSWAPSWPAQADNPYPNMGFGLYCTNCHSSARDNQTFASLRNIAGEPGEPLVFLNHDFFLSGDFAAQGRIGTRSGAGPVPFLTHHEEIAEKAKVQRGVRVERPYRPEFTALYQPLGGVLPFSVGFLPSETYDHVWAPAGEPSATSQFVTSDQCIGCHGAGGTGLQFQEVAPVGVEDDPDYRDVGQDEIVYQVNLAELSGKPALVRATLYYQAAPPYYLQDRFCTSRSEDAARLYYLAGKLDLAGEPIKDWKLKVGKSAQASVP